MTKQQLEQKIRVLTVLYLDGGLDLKTAFSQQSSLLAEYFADTSCTPEQEFIARLKAIEEYCDARNKTLEHGIEAYRYRLASREAANVWKTLLGERDDIIGRVYFPKAHTFTIRGILIGLDVPSIDTNEMICCSISDLSMVDSVVSATIPDVAVINAKSTTEDLVLSIQRISPRTRIILVVESEQVLDTISCKIDSYLLSSTLNPKSLIQEIKETFEGRGALVRFQG